MKLQLSDKDRKTLFIFLSLIVIACSFFFVYLPNTREASSIDEEKAQLEEQLLIYQSQEMKVKELKDEIKKYDEDSKKILTNFPNNLTQEKAIRIIRDMELGCNVDVDVVGFSAMQQFYTPTDENLPAGFKMDLNLSYETTYENAKKMIDFINEYKESISITSVSLGYDNTTGILTGDMSISMYYVPNGGTEYVVPDFGNIPIGVTNIFGTLSQNGQLVSPNPALNKTDANEDSAENTNSKNAKPKK